MRYFEFCKKNSIISRKLLIEYYIEDWDDGLCVELYYSNKMFFQISKFVSAWYSNYAYSTSVCDINFSFNSQSNIHKTKTSSLCRKFNHITYVYLYTSFYSTLCMSINIRHFIPVANPILMTTIYELHTWYMQLNTYTIT